MDGFFVVALVGIDPDGRTDERTKFLRTWDEVHAALDELLLSEIAWRAITIVRAEDAPQLMTGAHRVGEPMPV